MYVVFDIKSRVLWWSVHIIHARRNLLLDTKGQLISKWLFSFSILPKDERQIIAPVGYLGQKLTFLSWFFGRVEDSKISFRD